MSSPPAHGRSAGARNAADSAARSGRALIARLRPGPAEEASAVRVLTIGRDAGDLRALWGDRQRLARVLAEPYTGHPSTWEVEEVSLDGDRVRFRARSGQADPLRATGTVSFATAPHGLGTEVTLSLELAGPRLAAGAAAHKALRRAKALAETGEIPTLAHNSSARHEQSPEEH